MKYRDILGFSKKQLKKKVVKEQLKPTVADTLKEQFGDVMNEGPAYEYAGQMKRIEKAENLQAKEVNKLIKLLEKKGFKKEARDLAYEYMSGMRKFNTFLRKLESSLI